MNRYALILIATVSFAGCDSISRTELSFQTGTSFDSTSARDEITNVTSNTAAGFGLNEIERRETDISFSDSLSRPGQNPDLWLTVKYSTGSPEIEITEMYIANPTGKHKQLAESLVRELNANGYNAIIAYQTPGARNWSRLLGAALLLAGLVIWIRSGKRKINPLA